MIATFFVPYRHVFPMRIVEADLFVWNHAPLAPVSDHDRGSYRLLEAYQSSRDLSESDLTVVLLVHSGFHLL